MSDLRAVKKYAAQHDLFNRLHSIAADDAFVKSVANNWYGGRFEVVPNQRCGTWYCDPATSSEVYAYFKSTDGHMSHWDFNLRRSNLSFASYAAERGGLILVDSTRKGKRMPDGLSKTVPIWCAVINLAISLREKRGEEWDTQIYMPPQIVPATERSQIEARLQGWAESLERSTLPLPKLSKPLRPFFLHPSTSSPPFIADSVDFTPIMCLSASRWVNEGGDKIPSVTSVGLRKVGFEYVPGGGDDDELWARGLKPAVFHAHRGELLSAERDDLPALVDMIVGSSNSESTLSTRLDDMSVSSSAEFVGVPASHSRLALDVGSPSSPSSSSAWERSHISYVAIIKLDKCPKNIKHLITLQDGERYVLAVPSAKADGKAYSTALSELVAFAKELDGKRGIVIGSATPSDLDAAVKQCSSDAQINPFSAARIPSPIESRKDIIPLALVLLCALPSIADLPEKTSVTKGTIADRLHSMVSLWPDGNPARAALKRVNEFLMGEGRR
ncbi:hypothetical protein, variant [Cryptococcus amylolentus CBS 6039]|uniref:Initiator tRNA phosphoribosyl transferase n=1 Tax=Cryptococcus amylolentus CBS 6039 TaxID=1295533 RepID=A0A1E3H8Z7_9TREE|nr:hypothetical protein L202_08243 [Cryptococcus amylolentus CBS 6039]XP_018988751.1 hypothetical protein, variant [Cryptococcus amylolentus CBS 6039]ODN72809.1 hypothetical protein L202_08243 [Cryptococcus amylolentus CBS 6039]ODN72810.1 hypothetical protein, variant [Cryptococcus amylolentus CBS 6039]